MRFHFVRGTSQAAIEDCRLFERRYAQSSLDECDVVVSVGGDGCLLNTVKMVGGKKPVFGMNRGTIGFLLNEFNLTDLNDRIHNARRVTIHPLRMIAETSDGQKVEAFALNEVALFRQTSQAAHISIKVDGVLRMEQLICDGVLLATPAGSTAYNLSAHGSILPLRSKLMALTPISAFRPRRWRGALLPDNARVEFKTLDAGKRLLSATADSTEIREVICVSVNMALEKSYQLLFDAGQALEERILQEQFAE